MENPERVSSKETVKAIWGGAGPPVPRPLAGLSEMYGTPPPVFLHAPGSWHQLCISPAPHPPLLTPPHSLFPEENPIWTKLVGGTSYLWLL